MYVKIQYRKKFGATPTRVHLRCHYTVFFFSDIFGHKCFTCPYPLSFAGGHAANNLYRELSRAWRSMRGRQSKGVGRGKIASRENDEGSQGS